MPVSYTHLICRSYYRDINDLVLPSAYNKGELYFGDLSGSEKPTEQLSCLREILFGFFIFSRVKCSMALIQTIRLYYLYAILLNL